MNTTGPVQRNDVEEASSKDYGGVSNNDRPCQQNLVKSQQHSQINAQAQQACPNNRIAVQPMSTISFSLTRGASVDHQSDGIKESATITFQIATCLVYTSLNTRHAPFPLNLANWMNKSKCFLRCERHTRFARC